MPHFSIKITLFVILHIPYLFLIISYIHQQMYRIRYKIYRSFRRLLHVSASMCHPQKLIKDYTNRHINYCSIVRLKPDGTRWRTGGEVKGKLANGVGNQYSSHYLGTWCIQHYYRWCAQLGCHQSTELTPHADLNGLVRFAERSNLVSVRVPSRFKRRLPRSEEQLQGFLKEMQRNVTSYVTWVLGK